MTIPQARHLSAERALSQAWQKPGQGGEVEASR